jgi:hypothetical protein
MRENPRLISVVVLNPHGEIIGHAVNQDGKVTRERAQAVAWSIIGRKANSCWTDTGPLAMAAEPLNQLLGVTVLACYLTCC